MSIREHVQQAASKNGELLHILSTTEDAVSKVPHIEVRALHLKAELLQQEKISAMLKEAYVKGLKSYQSYHDSTVRRLVYRLSNNAANFKAKAEKEEKMYRDVINDQQKARRRQEELQAAYQAVLNEKTDLEAAAARHAEAHQTIDDLYEELFAGPNPDFPEEDEREEAFHRASDSYEYGLKLLKTQKFSRTLLAQAATALRRANVATDEALKYMANKILGFSDTHLSALARSRTHVQQAQALADQATGTRGLHSQQLGEFREGYSTLTTNPSLDTVRRWRSEVSAAAERLAQQISMAKAEQQETYLVQRTLARDLEDTRQGLNQARQAIFERVTGFGEAAPAYHECCDRTKEIQPPEDPSTTESEPPPPHYDSIQNDGPSEVPEKGSFAINKHRDVPKYYPPPPSAE